MIGRTRHKAAVRTVAALLTAVLLPGCKTQKVQFTSIPPGATVTVGGKTGITPCTMRVAKEDGPAIFRLPSGEEKVVPIHDLDSHFDETSEVSGKALGGTLMVIGGTVALLGGAAVITALVLDGDEEEDMFSDPAEEDDNYELLGYGAAVAAVGIMVFAVGQWIYPEYDEAVLHVDFHGTERSESAEDALYEDTGYGARRLKKAVP